MEIRREGSRLLGKVRASLADRQDVYVGLGGPIERRRGVDVSLREAERAARVARQIGLPAGVVSIEDLLVVEALLADPDRAMRLRSLIDRLSENKGARAPLLTSLQAFVDNNLSLSVAAETIGVHPHTLAYRLRKIEHVLGLSLKVSAERQVVEMALLAHRLQLERKAP